ncbi:MAG: hypothetical protein B7Y15_08580 [Bacteroidetes bacterium 24-39-8]|jgi:mono/diheme cytochrome c family protein|nr:MAG: hypothetical protein B7Y69_07800 [Sphingobacteriia bacterium 35-40-8]OYZ50742.1 MAG: hypothetical protein B7Y15_08580 [Bacteroidetes bacterium 24-39-8]OZA61971.1 MAG: hypothetical protein B7X72_13085 [Sphingobacteriia bacterium 39-39-8]HQR93420.1 cytochrome c [Sediminibacterium sp.]HQS55793.1 cytochrome c [Sediminibacterium sp.]
MKAARGLMMMGLLCFGLNGFSQTAKPITKSVMDNGKAVYLSRCLACHQVDGGGVPRLNAPLDGASAVIAADKAKLIRIVLKGYSDRVEIDGEYYSNNMAPHADLNNQQIADVLTYIRNSWSNKASAVTAAEVKALRAKLK